MTLIIFKLIVIQTCILLTFCESSGESFELLCANDTESDCVQENSTEYFGNVTTEKIDNTTSLSLDENSTEPSDIPFESETPSIVGISTIRPSVVQSTTEASYEMHFVPEDVCSCDLTVQYCDVNCCCDEDCSSFDRRVFSHCFKRAPLTPDPRYCYQSNFIYHNNTEFKVSYTKGGLFCIVRNNAPIETRYIKRKVLNNLQDFHKVFGKHKFYQWPSVIKPEFTFEPTVYRSGSILWTISSETLAPLVFPTPLTSSFCGATSPIRYLLDRSESCTSLNLHCDIHSAASASLYYESFFMIASPHMMNSSHISHFFEQQECLSNACISFDLFLCSSKSVDDCMPVDDIEKPVYDNETKICRNMVQEVRYVFYHNGTEGITRAEVYFWFTSRRISENYLRQTFSVKFSWDGSPKKALERSGNPGYLVGKPVIIGKKMYLFDADDKIGKETIALSHDKSKWLTFPKASSNGLCVNDITDGNRISVTIGEDLKSSCFIELSLKDVSSEENCTLIQRKILYLMLGNIIANVSEEKQFEIFVSAFGDPNIEDTGNWIPILLENFPFFSVFWKRGETNLICGNIVKNVHISIIISKVGLAARPLIKILGVAISFGEKGDLIYDCSPLHCSDIDDTETRKFEISTSVSFLDISKPPIIHFAEPPVYEVKLPFDFFYPFLSSYASKPLSCWHALLLSAMWLSFILHRNT